MLYNICLDLGEISVEIEADSKEEAIDKAYELYDNGELCLPVYRAIGSIDEVKEE